VGGCQAPWKSGKRKKEELKGKPSNAGKRQFIARGEGRSVNGGYAMGDNRTLSRPNEMERSGVNVGCSDTGAHHSQQACAQEKFSSLGGIKKVDTRREEKERPAVNCER